MVKTQVQLSEAQVQALRTLAASRDTSVEALVREAVDLLLRGSPDANREELKRRAIAAAGRFRSGISDLSKDHDRYLDEAYQS